MTERSATANAVHKRANAFLGISSLVQASGVELLDDDEGSKKKKKLFQVERKENLNVNIYSFWGTETSFFFFHF